MRALLLAMLTVAIASVGTAAALRSTGSLNRAAVELVAVSDFEYHDRFCRAQYNNQTDRNACMMRATGTPLHAPYNERDDH